MKVGLRTDGYERVYIKDRGLVCVHRLVMEKRLGRRLLRSEHVHHIDGDRAHNDFRNLQVLTHTEHRRLHWLIRMGYWRPGQRYRHTSREREYLARMQKAS